MPLDDSSPHMHGNPGGKMKCRSLSRPWPAAAQKRIKIPQLFFGKPTPEGYITRGAEDFALVESTPIGDVIDDVRGFWRLCFPNGRENFVALI